MEFLAELAAPLLTGLLHGSLFPLMAVGLTMTFSVTRMINFAHAELVTLGAYAAVVAVNNYGWSLGPAMAAAVLIGLAAAVLVDELVYKPLTAMRAPDLYLMVASIGVSMVLRHIIYIFADLNGLLNVKARVLNNPVMFVGYGTVTTVHLWAVPAALLLALGLHLFLTQSLTGKVMRAVADNVMLAQASAAPVARIRRLAWIAAGSLAGLAGAVWAVYSPVTPSVGWGLLPRMFASAIIGGLVSFSGTFIGAYVVGFAENLGIFLANYFLGTPLDYRGIITFLIVAVMLLWRPAGVLAARGGGRW
ncbi:MAG: branched-chain amino acid ABC transporter permease [Limnochordales bacterium]